MRALAANGHECVVLSAGQGADRVVDGILIRNGQRIGDVVAEFDPDFVLVSSEDLSHVLLRDAHRAAKDRLIYIAHTPQWFPFGPEAWHQDAEATSLLQDALAIVAIGTHMAAYIHRHLGRAAQVVHPATYGVAPWPEYNNFEKQSVLIINPSAVKGLPIFLHLARRFPKRRFLALTGWGSTPQDIAAMAAQPNIELLDTVANIDDVFARTSVLVAPSLWYEGFGLVVTEAMLRGIPVLASAHGGLEEAAAASRYRLPVRPIVKWLPRHDETGMPIAVVDAQPVEAWAAALEDVLGDRERYDTERATVMSAAQDFAGTVKTDDLERLLNTLRLKRRRIYLIHNSTYYPGSGGGDKSNRILMEALAKEGHTLRVFTRLEKFGAEEDLTYRAKILERGMAVGDWKNIGVEFMFRGASVRVVTQLINLRKALEEDLAAFEPDTILASTDDPAHLLLEPALQYTAARLTYLVRATIALPFGPDASTMSEERTARLRRADSVVGVSEYVAQYCRDYGGLDAVHVPISLSDDPNPPDVGRFENAYVTLVNPSAVKGLPILLGLADAMPGTAFAAVPSWGTTEADYAAMRARSNIHMMDRVDDITEVLCRTRVTLVPSLWAEARSRMVLESLSRGVPVLASDVGGLREAMCGMDFVLPVNQIRHYKTTVSDQMVPEAEVPPQDLAPWVAALQRLLENRTAWQDLRDRGRAAALDYLQGLSVAPLERIFRGPKRVPVASVAKTVQLSETKRKLLALRLAQYQQARVNRYFPLQWGEGIKVYLFPWAAAGTQAWRFLREEMQDGFALVPALLPGREERAGQPLPDNLSRVASAICDEMETSENKGDYLLAGHSMGGGLAFEVARELRRRGCKMPMGIVLSSCTAPHSRLVRAGEKTDALGLQQSDEQMFRQHCYEAEAPLNLPITVIAGDQEALEVDAWALETSSQFRRVTASGGHFWLLSQPSLLAEEVQRLARWQSRSDRA